MENIHNTPATLEQHTEYLKDPTSSIAKPYSTVQQKANMEHARKVWLYHKDGDPVKHGGKLFDISEVDQAIADGWTDEPYIHPNCPDKKREVKPVETDELTALRAEAESMGIKVDKRWGFDKIKAAMLEA